MVEYAQSSKQTFAKTVENDNLFKNYTCILLDIPTFIKKQRNWVHEMEIRQLPKNYSLNWIIINGKWFKLLHTMT